MCRNIKPLFNFEPATTDEEIKLASLQYVRKVTGFTHPSAINEKAFHEAVEAIALTTQRLLNSLATSSPARNHEVEAAKAKARSAKRFAHPA